VVGLGEAARATSEELAARVKALAVGALRREGGAQADESLAQPEKKARPEKKSRLKVAAARTREASARASPARDRAG